MLSYCVSGCAAYVEVPGEADEEDMFLVTKVQEGVCALCEKEDRGANGAVKTSSGDAGQVKGSLHWVIRYGCEEAFTTAEFKTLAFQ